MSEKAANDVTMAVWKAALEAEVQAFRDETLRAMNRVRREGGLEGVPIAAVPWRRPIVRVFNVEVPGRPCPSTDWR